MTAFVASFILVFLAEMGDKTQLLSMAFAAKYGARKVLTAVFLATLVINSIAVAIGRALTVVIPMDAISLAAAVSFIIFGMWMLRPEKTGGQDKGSSRYGPVMTVVIAFFLAELGDKTQLAAISLAVKYGNPIAVLAGATLGMVGANAVGVTAGAVIGRYIPEKVIKRLSAAAFILFGLIGIYGVIGR